MLATPSRGRFVRERFLVFEPPLPYMWLIYGTFLFAAFSLYRTFANGEFSTWWLFLSVSTALAGLWAHLSVTRIRLDLRNKSYVRWVGTGLNRRSITGPLTEFDAIVVTRENADYRGLIPIHVTLHYKQGRAVCMILETFYSSATSPSILEPQIRSVVSRAVRYASALEIPLFDNAYYASPPPIPLFNG